MLPPMTILTILLIITALVCISQLVAFTRMYGYVNRALAKGNPSYMPQLCVILPCKGLDPGFEDNVRKLLAQDYWQDGRPKFQVIFTVASESDPAYPLLKKISEAEQNVPCDLVVAGVNPIRAQKVNNQLAALKLMPENIEAIAFVDSDVIARADFLRHLIGGLDDPKVGATTGYRFYIPERADGPALIRSLWNRMSAWELVSPRYSFAWGGAMAIRRAVFEKARVAMHWERACDDDLALTTAVKAIGLEVKFIPQCLVASHGDGSWDEVVEWTNRQLILTKVYYPRLWRVAIARAAIMGLWLMLMGFSAGAYLSNPEPGYRDAIVAGLLLLPLEVLFLVIGQHLWSKVLTDRQDQIAGLFLKFILAVPLAHLTLPWMTLYSVTTNRIQWRGVTYELRSPTETVII